MKMKDFIHFKSEDEMIPDPIDAQEALDVLCDFFLGDDYAIPVSCNQGQANVIITDRILSLYPQKYKEFCRAKGWDTSRFKYN
jgi:hypothetical protein